MQLRGGVVSILVLTLLVGCANSETKSESAIPSSTTTSAGTSGSAPPVVTSTPPGGAGSQAAGASGLDGLWEEVVAHAGNTGTGMNDSDVGPLLGSPVRLTTSGTTTKITLTKPTPYGRCDGKSGPVAPAGTLVGTFATSGASYKGNVAYWYWKKCSPAGSYNWTLTPKTSLDNEPVFSAQGDGFELRLEIHRCPGGVQVSTVDPLKHPGCYAK